MARGAGLGTEPYIYSEAMPIYEYRCKKGHTFEVMQRMTEDALTECGTCGAPVQRVFHPVAVHFKGSGFYNTDYGRKGSKPSNDGSDSSSSEAGSNSSSEGSKSDSKSSKESATPSNGTASSSSKSESD